jgi:hypothetical protein
MALLDVLETKLGDQGFGQISFDHLIREGAFLLHPEFGVL